MNHIPVLIILFPLCGAVLCPLISFLNPAWGKRAVVGTLFASFALSVIQLAGIVQTGEPVHYWMGGWAPPYGIEFVIDGVNGIIIVLVAFIGAFTSLFSSPFEEANPNHRFKSAGYYSILCFLVIGLLGLSSTGDAFNLYVFMEIVALSGYGLIAIGEEKGPIAAFRYLLTGTIGACMYLMGVGFLYSATGTLNMADLAIKLKEIDNTHIIILAMACMIVGFGIKMALFPLHGWQPPAHSYAHPAADPMIAGVMIKIPAYGMMRFFFCIFEETHPAAEVVFNIIGVMAVCGILFGSLKALRYDKYNKILAYSSIGQVGYIALGISLGNFYGLVGAVLHILSHAFMKTGLFYTSAALKYKFGIHYTDELGQIYRKMPVTGTAMVALSLSMIGLPPFAGFFSKWYLALGAIQNGQYFYVAVLIVSSLLSAIYFFRIFERLFMGEEKQLEDHYPAAEHGRKEVPLRMIIPVVIAAVMVVLLGLGNTFIVNNVLEITVMEVFLG
ncbi:MAG: monovalent cation/H+ antiporter subunit D family protein [Firmicutes bacterium]|nr:monovalent cation/H+ antiporter subunit D family protein [Bacillota bacterium]